MRTIGFKRNEPHPAVHNPGPAEDFSVSSIKIPAVAPGMKIFSLFDGIAVAFEAVKAVFPAAEIKYFASEIDRKAKEVAADNHPEIIQLGDVREIKGVDLPDDLDLLIGGSPCQSFSSNGDGSGFDGKSGLFWEFVRLLEECKPKYFLFENVASMKTEWKNIITKALGVEPIKIDSGLLTAQNRDRYYWTNIPSKGDFTDRNIKFEDVADPGRKDGFLKYPKLIWKIDGSYVCKNATVKGWTPVENGDSVNLTRPNSTRRGRVAKKKKVPTLTKHCDIGLFWNGLIRKVSQRECERFTGLRHGYTRRLKKTPAMMLMANAFTQPVIEEFLRGMDLHHASDPSTTTHTSAPRSGPKYYRGARTARFSRGYRAG